MYHLYPWLQFRHTVPPSLRNSDLIGQHSTSITSNPHHNSQSPSPHNRATILPQNTLSTRTFEPPFLRAPPHTPATQLASAHAPMPNPLPLRSHAYIIPARARIRARDIRLQRLDITVRAYISRKAIWGAAPARALFIIEPSPLPSARAPRGAPPLGSIN